MRRVLCIHLPLLATQRVRREAAEDAAPEGAAREGGAIAAETCRRESGRHGTHAAGTHAAGPGTCGPHTSAADVHGPQAPHGQVPRGVASLGHERPLVLVRTVGASQLVAQACPLAQQCGIRVGTTLGQAQTLAPQLLVAPDEPARDVWLLRKLADWAIRFSPLVEPVPPDMLVVDITGCQLLFGGEKQIAVQAVTGLKAQGFAAQAAVADTVGAAWALALAGDAVVTVVPPNRTAEWLAPLPPAALRLEANTAAQLDQLGVRTIGALLALPRALLPARFGPEVVQRLQQALGDTCEPLNPYVAEAPPYARRMFETPVTQWAIVAAVVQQLWADVYAQVLQRGRALRRLQCVVYYQMVAPRVVTVGLSRASRTAAHVAELLARRVEQVDVAPGVTALVLRALQTTRFVGAQFDLFEQQDPVADEALGTLVDRLSARLGGRAVTCVEEVADHQPELAYRYVGYAEGERSREQEIERSRGKDGNARERGSERSREHATVCHRSVSSAPGSTAPIAGGIMPEHAAQGSAAANERSSASMRIRLGGGGERPTWNRENDCGPCTERAVADVAPLSATSPRPVQLFRRPIVVRVVAVVPDGPPAWFFYNSTQHVVTQAWGPERIETGWWRGPDVRRDYYRVATESGAQWWLFYEAATAQWYLHGVFV